MKILHIVSSLNVGGAERFVIDLAYEQCKQHHVEILSMGQQDEPLAQELTKENITTHYGYSVTILKNILPIFDVVHIHSSHCLLRVLIASLFNNKTNIVYTRHNERVHRRLKWQLTYMLARIKLHKMVFVAEKAMQNYLNFYPQFRQKSQVILNGVLPITGDKTPSEKLRLGHIGRFVALKSQHCLIEAVALLPDELKAKISLNFFGTGELLVHNQNLAKKLIPEVEVTFSGFVCDRNEIFQQIDILVVTSETEGLSLAILEALASKTPIIASDVGGNPELVHHEKNGFLYPYHDIAALKTAIALLATDKKRYQVFSENCLHYYQQQFSMQRCANEYLESYQ